MPLKLADAQQERRDRAEELVLSQVDGVVEALCDAVQFDTNVPNYKLVGPAARNKLKGLINHYRKMARPFTACVRDNTKRFGPDRAKKVCAVLTDLEKGTTKWRNGGSHAGVKASTDQAVPDVPEIDEELFGLLHAIGQTAYRETLGLETA